MQSELDGWFVERAFDGDIPAPGEHRGGEGAGQSSHDPGGSRLLALHAENVHQVGPTTNSHV